MLGQDLNLKLLYCFQQFLAWPHSRRSINTCLLNNLEMEMDFSSHLCSLLPFLPRDFIHHWFLRNTPRVH